MAERTITVCDVHADEGKDVAGTTWTVTIGDPDGEPQTWTVDLCGAHAAPLAELATLLRDHGREVGGRAVHPSGVRAPAALVAVPAETVSTVQTLACPDPDCGHMAKSRKALSDHVRRKHGQSLTAAESPADGPDLTCPECGREFTTPQGKGAHRFRSHGVRSGEAV